MKTHYIDLARSLNQTMMNNKAIPRKQMGFREN
jgi:hypothetical protein